jgi:hypothetical protein
MNKLPYVLSLAVIILLGSNTFAQEKIWSIGPEAGLNYSKFGKDINQSDFKPGVVAGVFLTYSIINTFGITGKFLYSVKGDQLGNQKNHFKYFEFPLIGRFFLNKEGWFRPNVFVGPSFALLRGVTIEQDGEKMELKEYKDVFNTFDVGITGGLGLNFQIAKHTRFLVDARYTYGLTDITIDPGVVINQCVAVTGGFSFGI